MAQVQTSHTPAHAEPSRTPFAYCPPPSRRADDAFDRGQAPDPRHATPLWQWLALAGVIVAAALRIPGLPL